MKKRPVSSLATKQGRFIEKRRNLPADAGRLDHPTDAAHRIWRPVTANDGGPKGQSLIEFAVSVMVLLILLAGTVDFGIGLLHYVAMQDAAQEGALYGSIHPPNWAGDWTCPNPDISAICSRLLNTSGKEGILRDMYDAGMLATISVPERACEGYPLTVTIAYDYPLTMPFLGALIGSEFIHLRASATDTILTPSCP